MISIWRGRLRNLSERSLYFILFLLLAVSARGQDLGHEVPVDTLHKYGLYDTDRLPPSFHAGRRVLVLDSMAQHSIALWMSTPEKVRSNDVKYEYHQAPDFYYLTGCLEPESALLLSKDPILLNGREVHEILFVRNRNLSEETWTGQRLGPQGAMSILKVQAAMPMDSLHSFLQSLLGDRVTLYYRPRPEPLYDPVLDSTFVQSDDINRTIEARYPSLHLDAYIHSVIAALREIKTPEELRLMRRAISISNDAHNTVIKNARPGWYEYQIQATAEHLFTMNGAEYTAYPCIVGSGPNSTILHYETNRRQIKTGDFIEMDMGAEYHGYCADVTRSFPVAGTFTPEQRAIYELVFNAQDAGIKACVAGAPFRSAHWTAVKTIAAGLQKLGIIKDSADYKQYFMHGTSHYLGLDVHDVGFYGPLVPGNVLTVEPGIYIAEGSPCDPKWWNIGCRIEDDILVTDKGPEILSKNSPRTIGALEKLMTR